jgi:hypothetical protein
MPARLPSRQTRIGPFETTLFRYPGKGGWHFAIVPERLAPAATRPWGRTPVVATVDDETWTTSVWLDRKSNRSLLAVPKARRAGKGHGDAVTVTLVVNDED